MGDIHQLRPQAAAQAPYVICIPSTDPGFAAVVAHQLASKPMRGTWELQDALRPLFPGCVVRARDLSGEPGVTWYVYRDFDFPARSDAGQQDPST